MEKLDSSRTNINYVGLNELRRMIIIFNDFDRNIAGSLMFCFSRYKKRFSLKLAVTWSNLVKYPFVSKEAACTFSHGNIVSYLPKFSKFSKDLCVLLLTEHRNIGCITKALIGTMYLREVCIDSDITR